MDLQKVMTRIFKRAGFETLHSEGYKLRPLFSFGPALTLGISSLSEFFDVRVPFEWNDFAKVMEKLQTHSEPGIIFRSIKSIDKKTPSIQESAKSFTYFVPVENQEMISGVLDRLENQDKLVIQSYSKKEKKNLDKDIKPLFLSFSIDEINLSEDEKVQIREVSPCDGKGVVLKTLVKSGSGIRPSEITDLLVKEGLRVQRPIKLSVDIENIST